MAVVWPFRLVVFAVLVGVVGGLCLVSSSSLKSTKPPGTRHEGFGERRYVALAYKRRSRVGVFTTSMKPDPPTNCNPRTAAERPRVGFVMTEPVMIGDIANALGLGDHELVSLVGGGGKTTVLFALGSQLAGTVVLTTTTKMGRDRLGGYEPLVGPTDEALLDDLADRRVALAWRALSDRKALGVEPQVCDRWFGRLDHLVVEADGSRRMPFKAPLEYEPVVPSRTTTLVACVGAAALGAVISEQCQRPERVAAVAQCSPVDFLTPRRLAAVLVSDQGSRKDCPPSARFAVAINQVRSTHMSFVDELAEIIADVATLVCIAPFSPEDSPEASTVG